MEEQEGWLARALASAMPAADGVDRWVGGLGAHEPTALAQRAASRITWLHATQGAVLALPGAVPGIGTAAMLAVETGAMAAELGLMVRNQAYMTSAITRALGRPLDDEERYADAVVAIGLWTGALEATVDPKLAGRGFAVKGLKKVPTKVVKKMAVLVGKKLAARFATQRGLVVVGKAVPFGVGALVGGGFSLSSMRGFERVALRYLGETKQGESVIVGVDA
jgi:hypothetical protein